MTARAGNANARVRDLLTDSLALWRVSGAVEAGELPVVAVVHADSGTMVWVERAAGDHAPVRWLVRWRRAGEPAGSPRERHPRACASLVGLLNALRAALDVNRGSPVRIAPASEERPPLR